MLERRLLYLTQHQMIAFHWKSGMLTVEGEYLTETAGADFAQYLSDHASSLFSLVVNLGEEGFHPDVIPYLQAKDRTAVISRRLAQNFLGAPLAVALSHGYESGSRKNERLLLTALTGIALLDPWLKALQAVGSRLQGVYSLPLLSEGLVQRLGIKIARGILVTVQDNTIRQSFFNGGRLLFSRVAPLVGSSTSEIALGIASEANRFQQYLLSQRMVARGDHLSAHILTHPHAFGSIQAARFNDGIEITIHDLLLAGKKLGVKTLPIDNRAQHLFLHTAIANPPPQQFGTAALRQPYRLWKLGNAIRAAGAMAFAGCLLFSIKLMVDTNRANTDAAERKREAAAMEQSYQQALGRLPPIPLSNDALRQLVERVAQLKKNTDSPSHALKHLSTALEATPQVELVSIDWAAPGALASPTPAGNTPPRTGAMSENKETLLIKGNLILGASGSPRLLISTFDAFTKRLREGNPGTNVTVLKTPVDLNASRALKSTDSAASNRAPREFALQIEYSVQP